MNQDNESNIDTGSPLQPLANLEQEVSPQFMAVVRNKIYRRTATNQMVSFSWNLPKVILMEFVMLIAQMFQNQGEKEPG